MCSIMKYLMVVFVMFSSAVFAQTNTADKQELAQPQEVLSVLEQEAIQILLYPNPFKTTFTVDAGYEISNVKIYDFMGNLVEEANPNSIYFTMGAQLPDGVYTVVMTQKGKVKTQKIIKEK